MFVTEACARGGAGTIAGAVRAVVGVAVSVTRLECIRLGMSNQGNSNDRHCSYRKNPCVNYQRSMSSNQESQSYSEGRVA